MESSSSSLPIESSSSSLIVESSSSSLPVSSSSLFISEPPSALPEESSSDVPEEETCGHLCPVSLLGNGKCDTYCAVLSCRYDDFDCPVEVDDDSTAAYNEENKYRNIIGINYIPWSDEAFVECKKHNEYMITKVAISHDGFDGRCD